MNKYIVYAKREVLLGAIIITVAALIGTGRFFLSDFDFPVSTWFTALFVWLLVIGIKYEKKNVSTITFLERFVWAVMPLFGLTAVNFISMLSEASLRNILLFSMMMLFTLLMAFEVYRFNRKMNKR